MRQGARMRTRPWLVARHSTGIEVDVRSELVYGAALKIENRFLLAATAMRAVRKLHLTSTRTEDTVNRVLAEVANGTPAHGELPEIVSPPPIDLLLIAPAA